MEDQSPLDQLAQRVLQVAWDLEVGLEASLIHPVLVLEEG